MKNKLSKLIGKKSIELPRKEFHRYTLNVRFKISGRTSEIWYEYENPQDITKPFEDFITWYEAKPNKSTYKFVGSDFITVIHRDNLVGFDISYTKPKKFIP